MFEVTRSIGNLYSSEGRI